MKYNFIHTEIATFPGQDFCYSRKGLICNVFACGMLLQVFETKIILTSLENLLRWDYYFFPDMVAIDARFTNPKEIELDYLSHKGGERLTTSITLEEIYAFQPSRAVYNPMTEDSERFLRILSSPSKRMVIEISRHEQQMRMDGYCYTNVYIDGINIGPTAGWNVTWREDRTMLEDDEGMFFYVPPYQRYPDDRSILIRALDMCYFPLPIGMDYGYSNSIANVFGNGELLEVYENKLVLTSLTLLVSRVFHFKLPDSRIAEALFLGLDKIQIEYYQNTESPPRCRKKTVIPFSDFVKI